MSLLCRGDRLTAVLFSNGDSDDDLEFAGLVSHNLAVQKAEDATAGADQALEQLKSTMAAMRDVKEANKYAARPWLPLFAN